MATEQDVIDEFNKVQTFLAANPIDGFKKELEEELGAFSEEFSNLPQDLSSLRERISDFTEEAADSLESIEQSLSELFNEDLMQLMRETQEHLISAVNQLRADLTNGYQAAGRHGVTSIDAIGADLEHQIEEITEEMNNVAMLFQEVKEQISDSVETLNNVRKDVLSLTSPLRDTSSVVGDALKIATQIFEDVG